MKTVVVLVVFHAYILKGYDENLGIKNNLAH